MPHDPSQEHKPVSPTIDSARSNHRGDNLVVGCVDDSPYAPFVTDYAAWTAHRLGARLELLHVIDRTSDQDSSQDHSGALTANEQVHLMEKFVDEEAHKSRLARDRGRVFLNTLRLRALEFGVSQVDVRQRHGTLTESLLERESQLRLVVMGRRGESSSAHPLGIGQNLERVVRALKCPVLCTSDKFAKPKRLLIAFDGSRASRQAIEMVANSPAFEGLECVVVMVKDRESTDTHSQLSSAANQLSQAGLRVSTERRTGDLAIEISQCIQEQRIDLLVMGAYTHSPWRSLVRRSQTTKLLHAADVTTLLLR